jgi:hypothetical protein
MAARKIGLLLLILVVGGAVDASWAVRENIGVGASGCRVIGGRFYGPSFAFAADDVRPLAAGATVEIANAFGTVRVSQGEAGQLGVSLRKVVFRATESEARAFADRITFRRDDRGAAHVQLSTNREELERADPQVGFETHFELRVPPGTPVVVRNEHGRVEVADVASADVSGSFEPVRVERVAGRADVHGRHADVSVSQVGGALFLTSRHGSVDVREVEGAATLEVEHGDASISRVAAVAVQGAHADLELQGVRGDLEVRAHHSAVDAEDVTGRVEVQTSYQDVSVRRVSGETRLKVQHGSVEVSDAQGSLTVESSFAPVVLARVAGPVDVRVSHGGVQANGLEKGGRVSASGDDIVLHGFGGALDVEGERANVELRPAGALSEAVSARTRFGDISLQLPPGSRMRLEASTPRGELEADVPGLSLTREGAGRSTGSLGGGENPVRLTAEHGSVRVGASVGSAAVAGDETEEDDQEDEDTPRPPRKSTR